jgi:pyruvate formate lyase activating enzyme
VNPSTSLHVDTNGSILSDLYIDDLVEASMTEHRDRPQSPEGLHLPEIIGLADEALASRYMETAWKA